ncbi:hypothetical protein [Dyadobacter psychrotolerans]|uniref:Uncharacterized protein n=1 Tax=Dyadobacter psychrotolerans TaxID=2541721 RepID=A0A4R5E0N5_9BACT|nr:hypothetical protein [Dyadobacter psychrotolerans]TDE17153.1 hypothetical protein E0F88_04430 [Dyadobacter psychrotolerans]
MIHELRTYLFKLCLILLGGYGFCFASPAEQTRLVSLTQFNHSVYSNSCFNAETGNPRFADLCSSQEKSIKISTEKDEEEGGELSLSRTYTAARIDFAAVYTRASQIFYTLLKIRLSFCNHWFYNSSCRYIILRVIRL